MEYKTDLHIHSHCSFDSEVGPKEIVKLARKRGLSIIAITDHETIAGGLEVRDCARQTGNGLLVIVGTEITTEHGDVLGLFLEEEIRSRRFCEVVEEIREKGGLSVLAHPMRGRVREGLEILAGSVDAIETLNARCSKMENCLAERLAIRLGKRGLTGSDAHEPQEIGRVYGTLSDDDLPKASALTREMMLRSLFG